MNNKQLIEKFYKAFKKKDAKTMLSCYHNDVVFSDPVFGTLNAERVSGMWQMLCKAGKDLTITFDGVQADKDNGKAHWEASYTFSQTGKNVHNVIDATFKFKDGLIIEHTDVFNLRKCAGQALGFKGMLLGGTSFFKKKLQNQTNKKLDKFISETKS
jgi:ketosteroid isomerase-like protein